MKKEAKATDKRRTETSPWERSFAGKKEIIKTRTRRKKVGRKRVRPGPATTANWKNEG